MKEQEHTLQAVAAALATGSMPFDSLGLRQKRQRPRKMVIWDVEESGAVTESEGLGRNSKTRRLLPISDSLMPSHMGYVEPVQQALQNVQQGPLAGQPGHYIRTLAGTEDSALPLMEMDNAGSALVSDHPQSDWAPCLICNGIQDQETILTCQVCLYRTHVDCYFTAGSKDANETITDAEEWRCENCGGLGRHLHPRPVQGQRRNVTWTLALPSSSGIRAGTGGFGGGRLGVPRTNIDSGKGKEPMPADDDDRRLGNVGLTDDASVLANMTRAGTGGFGGGGLGAPRTNISRGKRKELIPVDEEDRRMGNADLMANENQLEHTTHFKRRGTPFMTPAQKESLKDADEDEKMCESVYLLFR